MGSGGPIRPGAPLPPRDPGYQPPPGQGQPPRGGSGRHAAGPGYAAPDGRRPGGPGTAGPVGPAGPAEAADQFDGGYAYVIRPSDNPARPPSPARPPARARPADPARSAEPARPPEPEVYVYRDTDGQPGDPRATPAGPDEHDAAYWYDLPGTGAKEAMTPRVSQETRGPFEPLVSSADPRPQQTPGTASADGQEYTQASKLEQIKDLYLTAEAIGEANVDKHFDHLLTQQRELISDYFKQSNAARPEGGGAGQAEAEGTRITADQPRVW